MTLACQKDSYLKELETKVLSCERTETSNGDIDYESEYQIILEDTVLFPEGGGQPDDIGTINQIPVLGVERKGREALHHVQAPLVVGENACVIVDWARRFDHMQQHTGQHLITAVAEDLLKYCTTSWTMGVDLSFVELDVPSLEDEEIQNLERVVNERIRDCIPVTIHLYEKGAPELSQVRTRLELPDDHVGPVRVVSIEGIDNNTCCGTHVKNTSELQVIKLLFAEKGKKNKTNLFFVAGNRVLKYLEETVSREKLLCQFLGCSMDSIVPLVQKLQSSFKVAHKNAVTTLRELAIVEARMFKSLDPRPRFFALHKKNAEPDFVTLFLNEVNDQTVLFFMTIGDGKNGGHMTLSGPDEVVQQFGPQICKILEGKGYGKQGRYQAKFTKTLNIHHVEKMLKSATEE